MGILCSCCKQTEMTDAWTFLGVSIVVVRGCDLLNMASTVQWGCGGVRAVGSGREIKRNYFSASFWLLQRASPGALKHLSLVTLCMVICTKVVPRPP